MPWPAGLYAPDHYMSPEDHMMVSGTFCVGLDLLTSPNPVGDNSVVITSTGPKFAAYKWHALCYLQHLRTHLLGSKPPGYSGYLVPTIAADRSGVRAEFMRCQAEDDIFKTYHPHLRRQWVAMLLNRANRLVPTAQPSGLSPVAMSEPSGSSSISNTAQQPTSGHSDEESAASHGN